MSASTTPLPLFIQPTARDHRIAREVVDSHPVVSAYASCAWDELHDDGRVWMAAVVREAQARAAPSADTIVAVNAFLTQMADRFRERTMRRFLGIRVNTMSPMEVMAHALATFDAAQELDGGTFGDAEHAWDRDHAHELVDEELRHWEA